MLKARRDCEPPDAFLRELEEMSEALELSPNDLVAVILDHYFKTVIARALKTAIARGSLDLKTIEQSNEPISRLLYGWAATPTEVLIAALAEYKTLIQVPVRLAPKNDYLF